MVVEEKGAAPGAATAEASKKAARGTAFDSKRGFDERYAALEVDRRGLAVALVGLELVGDLLTFAQARMPERSTAEMWTNTSLPPWSGWMKP